MLTKILELFSEGIILSLSELSNRLGYTAEEIESGLEQLTRMGYIENVEFSQECGNCGGSCGGGCGSHCDSCTITHQNNTVSTRRITKKGKSYLEKKKRG